jgi:hypothetical protein
MAQPIKEVAAELFASSINPFATIEECTTAIKAARCKDDHPAVWGTSATKAIAFFTALANPAPPAVEGDAAPAPAAKAKGLTKGKINTAPVAEKTDEELLLEGE